MFGQGEREQVKTLFGSHFQSDLCDRRGKRVWSALEGVTDPEQKRKIIGRLFVEETEREAKEWLEPNGLLKGPYTPM